MLTNDGDAMHRHHYSPATGSMAVRRALPQQKIAVF